MDQASPSRPFARPRVSVAVDETTPPGMPSPGRMIDMLTPKTRRVSKLPQAEVRTQQKNISRCGPSARRSYSNRLTTPCLLFTLFAGLVEWLLDCAAEPGIGGGLQMCGKCISGPGGPSDGACSPSESQWVGHSCIRNSTYALLKKLQAWPCNDILYGRHVHESGMCGAGTRC